jgi:mRNA interferase MazF
MIVFEPGDVALVALPYTDLLSVKKRPAIVIGPSDFSRRYGDTIVLALTSRPSEDEALRLDDWREAGLLKPTWIKPVISTLASHVFERRLGTITERDRKRVTASLDSMIALTRLGHSEW